VSTDEVLNHPTVQSMKAKALAALKSGPPGPQAGQGEMPGWRFPQAWHAAWQQNQDLQNEILALGGTLVPQNDKTLEYVPQSDQDSPWAENKFSILSKARAKACDQVVKAVQAAHPAMSYDQAWQIAQAQNKQLFTPSESGDELSDENFQKDYQLRVVYGIRK
jgi:hypothetical protein